MLAGRTINMIVATDLQSAIGFKNIIPWNVRSDMQRFRKLTTGNSVIMGRKTFQSLPKGALPHRQNIVLTRSESSIFDGCETAHSFQEAVELCHPDKEIFVIGGAEIYQLALPYADEIHMSTIICQLSEADAFFSEIHESEWESLADEYVSKSETNEYAHNYYHLKRIG